MITPEGRVPHVKGEEKPKDLAAAVCHIISIKTRNNDVPPPADNNFCIGFEGSKSVARLPSHNRNERSEGDDGEGGEHNPGPLLPLLVDVFARRYPDVNCRGDAYHCRPAQIPQTPLVYASVILKLQKS